MIVGGGFGGLYAAKALADAPVDVTLVDRRNHHLFQPLLYQVATAELSPSEIAMPLRRILRKQRGTTVLLGDVVDVDVEGRRVVLRDGEIGYDYLVVATGSTSYYFGHDEWAERAPSLKTVEDGLEIRRRVLFAFEAAERESDPVRRRAWLTFVIVGAGPTGMELAGAFAEIARHTLEGEFRRADVASARIVLIEGVERILPTFSEGLSKRAERQLQRRGVEVRPGTLVTNIDESGVWLGDEHIAARTVIWAAGVAASPLGAALGAPLDRSGRVVVTPELTLPDHREVFVIGDLAHAEMDGVLVPGVAPAAIQEGRHVGRSIRAAINGRPYAPFRYREKGMLATIGRGAGVAELPYARVSGLVAWVLWLTIHIFYLIGFRNRMLVMLHWVWSYLNWERRARLITGITRPVVVEPAMAEDAEMAPAPESVSDGKSPVPTSVNAGGDGVAPLPAAAAADQES